MTLRLGNEPILTDSPFLEAADSHLAPSPTRARAVCGLCIIQSCDR